MTGPSGLETFFVVLHRVSLTEPITLVSCAYTRADAYRQTQYPGTYWVACVGHDPGDEDRA